MIFTERFIIGAIVLSMLFLLFGGILEDWLNRRR